MNFEDIHKKYFNPSEDDDSSLASTTSDVSFTMTKKEVKVEKNTLDGDKISELVKSMEQHEDIKLDDSLIDKANEIYSYMKDSSESSNPNDSEKGQEDKSLDLSLNDSNSELKKVADNLESTKLEESANEGENDFKEVVKNLEAAMNESFNEENAGKTNSDLNEIQSEQINLKADEPEIEVKENLAKIVEDIVAPLGSFGSENLTKIADEAIQSEEKEPSGESNDQQIEAKITETEHNEPEKKESEAEQSFGELDESKKTEDSQSALSQIMQFVTGLTTLGSSNDKAPETENNNEEFTDIVKEIQNDLNTSQALESGAEPESVPDSTVDSQKVESNQINESINEESHQSLGEDNQQSELDASLISNIEEEVKQSDSEEQAKVEVNQNQSQPEEQSDELKQEEQVKSEEVMVEQEAKSEQLTDELKDYVNQVTQELIPTQGSELNQDFEINISERITTLAQELTKEPQLEEQVETTGEIRQSPEDGISVNSPDEILLRKEEILNKYKIDEEQFNLCREFFNERKDGSLLSNFELRALMREALKKRPQVKAEDADIDRALEAVDEDKDDKITFDELIQFLLLFFSSKTNVENRIGNILKARLSSENLSANEAVEFANFLNKFYGQTSDGEKYKEDLNLSDFLKDVLPNLGSLAFVQQEENKEESSGQNGDHEEKKDQENQESTEQSNDEASQSSEHAEA